MQQLKKLPSKSSSRSKLDFGTGVLEFFALESSPTSESESDCVPSESDEEYASEPDSELEWFFLN